MKNKVHNYSSFSLFQQQKHCSSLFLIKDQPLLDLFFLEYKLKVFLNPFLKRNEDFCFLHHFTNLHVFTISLCFYTQQHNNCC